jgi:uridine kinase
MEAGADLQEFVIPYLEDHLAELKSGQPVVDPATGQTIPAGPRILFETPFARQHEATGKSIDLSIWIDTPLDIALARNLRDFTARPELYEDFGPWLSGYLDNYLGTVRDLLTMQREVVGSAADLRLDGRATVDTNVDLAESAIRQHERSKL